jgi:hypothetical protein
LVINQSTSASQQLHEYLKHKVHWKTVGLQLLVGLCVLAVVVWFGRHATGEIRTKVAGHASDHSTLHTVVVIAGFAIWRDKRTFKPHRRSPQGYDCATTSAPA